MLMLARIYLAWPVTSVECERSFSVLRRTTGQSCARYFNVVHLCSLMCRWHCDVWQGRWCYRFYALQLCKRMLVTIKPSVRLSVRPFVRHTRVLWQNERKFCQHCYTIWKIHSSSFLTRRMVGGGRPLLPEILDQTDPHPVSKTAIFNRYSLIAPQLLFNYITTSFPMSLGWTAYVASNPQKGAHKCKLTIFCLKSVLLSKKVCCKVSLCEKFQPQSCKAFTGLSSRAQWSVADWPYGHSGNARWAGCWSKKWAAGLGKNNYWIIATKNSCQMSKGLYYIEMSKVMKKWRLRVTFKM